MLVVLDDVLDEPRRVAVARFFSQSEDARSMKWEDRTYEALAGDESPMAIILRTAAKYFDLSGMAGAEYWAHLGTRPEWHIDKDETQYRLSGETLCPLCSIVYYADVAATGGDFVSETMSVAPVTNRVLMFSAGMWHGVNPYTGTRLAVAINPWGRKPLGYV